MWFLLNTFMKLTIPWIIVVIIFMIIEKSFLSIPGFSTIVILLVWSYWFIRGRKK